MSTDLRYFKYDHLPPHLQAISKPFADLAAQVRDTVPEGRARRIALDQLVSAKDWAVRAFVLDGAPDA